MNQQSAQTYPLRALPNDSYSQQLINLSGEQMPQAKQVLQQMESQRSDRNVSGSPSAVKTVQWDMIESKRFVSAD